MQNGPVEVAGNIATTAPIATTERGDAWEADDVAPGALDFDPGRF